MTMNKMFGPLAGILGSPKNSDLVGWGGVPTRESLLRARESFTGWDRLGVELGWGARRSAAVTDRRGWRPGGERSFSFPDDCSVILTPARKPCSVCGAEAARHARF